MQMVVYLAVWLMPQFTLGITQDKTSKNVVVLSIDVVCVSTKKKQNDKTDLDSLSVNSTLQ